MDHFSWVPPSCRKRGRDKESRRAGSTNGCASVCEKLKHDHLDALLQAVGMFMDRTAAVPGALCAWFVCLCAFILMQGLFKVDVNAAYRRLPIMPEHRWAAGVVYRFKQQVMASVHYAMPFGAIASVHEWEKLGGLLLEVVLLLLRVVCFRYVDDFFGAEPMETLEHTLGCVVRVVRALLGVTSISDDKVDCGPGLRVLGVDIEITIDWYCCRPAKETLLKCLLVINMALELGVLTTGDAMKLAGRLAWANQHLFRKIGKSMLGPIFRQKLTRDGSVTADLRVALIWWRWVLGHEIAEKRSWVEPVSLPLILLVDARSTPARCAAVLVKGAEILYTDGAPSEGIMKQFTKRGDGQIMTLEILAIAVGLSTFAEEIKGGRLFIYSDNVGAEGAAREGKAKRWDHAKLVHGIWVQLLTYKTQPWFLRVPTAENISDCPSREVYRLMKRLRGIWREPKLADMYVDRGSRSS